LFLFMEWVNKKLCDYWSEPNKSNTKFRYELEKTWDTERRLKTWNQNNFEIILTIKNKKQDELTRLASEIKNRENWSRTKKIDLRDFNSCVR
jgi:hypothetical protein